MDKNSILLESDFRNAFLKHARKLYPDFSMSNVNWERLDRVVMNEIQAVHEENRNAVLRDVSDKYLCRLGNDFVKIDNALLFIFLWIIGLTIYVIVKV